MSDVLERICADKRAEVACRKGARGIAELETAARSASPPRGFATALDRAVASGGKALIAEIKKASPSGGLIRPVFDPPRLAAAYRAGGAACLSVLTDGRWFEGCDADLAAARDAVPLPVLRKDFMLDPWQVVEARAIGADAILVILAAVDDGLARELMAVASDHGMDALVETHDEDEVDRAVALGATLIGINNRNLRTLVTDLAVTGRLAARVPDDRAIVSESGIRTASDLAHLATLGAHRYLVGERLMRRDDVTAATRDLLAPAPETTRQAV